MSIFAGLTEFVRPISDSTLDSVCDIFLYQGTISTTPTMNNRGNPSQLFDSPTLSNVPCRMDTAAPQERVNIKERSNIVSEKPLQLLFISYEYLSAVGIELKTKDEIVTAAGSPIGRARRYSIVYVYEETDEVDLSYLIQALN